jgi:quinol monooxygenase YgiN
MLHVVVTMKIKEGRMDAFLALCAELRPQVLAEPGCHGYEFTRDARGSMLPQAPDPRRIVLVERWESAAALKAHLETEHMRAAGPRLAELRESSEVLVLEPVH